MRQPRRAKFLSGLVAVGTAALLLRSPEAQTRTAVPQARLAAAAAGELWAAARRADITPPEGTPLGGYGGGRRRLDPPYLPDLNPFNYFTWFRPYEGIHDRVYAKVLLLDNGASRVLIVGMDTIGATDRFRKDIAAHAAKHGIPESNVFVSGTHNHGGPGALADQKFWYLVAMDAFDLGLYMRTLQPVYQAIDQAAGGLEPASLGLGRAEAFHLSENRRGHEGRFDPEIGVISVERRDGSPIAVVFNFAVHGTAIGPHNLHVTRDLMGYAEDKLEATLGGGVAIFVNGAEGDVSPNKNGLPSFEGAQWCGEGIADEVLKILQTVSVSPVVELEARAHRLRLPTPYVQCDDTWDSPSNICSQIPDRVPDRWKRISLDGLMDEEAQFHALRIDDAVMATVPGEAITNVGLAIKAGIRERGYGLGLVFGCTNGHISYITTEEEYKEGGYESTATLYGPGTGALVVDSALKAVDLLAEPSSGTVRVGG